MPSFHSQKAVLALVCLALLSACLSPTEANDSGGRAGQGGASAGPPAAAGVGGSSVVTAGAGVSGAGGATGAMPGTTPPGSGSAAAGVGAGTAGAGGSATGDAGSEGTAGAGTNDAAIDIGNYFKSGAWMGYVWTSASGEGSTITPMDFEAQTTGMPRCVSGMVSAQADFSGTAILGFNLNEGAGATGTPVAPTKAGVTIGITNRGGSVLRLQVQTASTGGTQWCTTLVGSGGFIPWGNLRTECWGATGSKYDREPIVSVMVLVPGKDTMPVAFDFCVDMLAEAEGPNA